ncbi:hypothetical protein ACFVH0_14390 [Streptomyces sp. NPDC127117]|uniref:hypothetical protein n=1 Tax=Streptomyces sp. NPDC127117 TaxID=3345368 RepID=UPI003643B62A
MTDQPRAYIEALADPAQGNAFQPFGQGNRGSRVNYFRTSIGRRLPNASPLDSWRHETNAIECVTNRQMRGYAHRAEARMTSTAPDLAEDAPALDPVPDQPGRI